MKDHDREVIEESFEMIKNPRPVFAGAHHFRLVMGDSVMPTDPEALMYILGKELVEQGLAEISIVDGHSQIEFKFMTEKHAVSSAIN